MDREGELENCKFVKTVLMVIIVLYHSMIFYAERNWFVVQPSAYSEILRFFCTWINGIHIYTFILVSGYIFYAVVEKGGYTEFRGFISKKFCRLILPYIVASACWVIPINGLFYKYTLSDIIRKFLLAQSPSQLWFLVVLFEIFVFSWCFLRYIEEHTYSTILICSVFCLVGIFGAHLTPNYFQIWKTCQCLIYFIIGMKLRQLRSSYGKKIWIPLLLLCNISLFLINNYYPSQTSSFAIGCVEKVVDILIHISGSLFLFYFLQFIANSINWHSNAFLYFSTKSMTIYLLHQQIIYIGIWLLHGSMNMILLIPILFFGTISVSLLLATFLHKSKYTRFLLGEK